MRVGFQLKFTPLEFETCISSSLAALSSTLKFTPLEFETEFPLKRQG